MGYLDNIYFITIIQDQKKTQMGSVQQKHDKEATMDSFKCVKVCILRKVLKQINDFNKNIREGNIPER